MSSVSNLYKDDGYMVTWCPCCGERIEVDDADCNATLDDGTKEYELWCPNEWCQCHFYANENYT